MCGKICIDSLGAQRILGYSYRIRNPHKIVDIICIFYVHASAAIQIVQLVPMKNNIKVVYSKLFEYVDIYDIHDKQNYYCP